MSSGRNGVEAERQRRRRSDQVGDGVHGERGGGSRGGDDAGGDHRSEHHREVGGRGEHRVGVEEPVGWNGAGQEGGVGRGGEGLADAVQDRERQQRGQVSRGDHRERYCRVGQVGGDRDRSRADPVDQQAGRGSQQDGWQSPGQHEQAQVRRAELELVRGVAPHGDERGPRADSVEGVAEGE